MRAKRIHPWHLGMVIVSLAVLAIITFAGCLEFDDAVQDVNTVATTAKTVLDSPAGRMIPPDVRLYRSLAVSAVMAGAAGYKQWRLAQMTKTTKAIVLGIESQQLMSRVDPENPVTAKTAIAAKMRDLGIYDTGNKIVKRLKLS